MYLSILVLFILRPNVRNHHLPDALIFLREEHRVLARLGDDHFPCGRRLDEWALPPFGARSVSLLVCEDPGFDVRLNCGEEGRSGELAGDY